TRPPTVFLAQGSPRRPDRCKETGTVTRPFLIFLLVALGVCIALAPGCSSKDCDPSQCAPNNKCIDDRSTRTEGRLVCTSSDGCDNHRGYHCATAPNGTGYCAVDKAQYNNTGLGQWGHHCDATKGLDQNPDCDFNQSFWCFAKAPTDGDAYCTQ